MGDLVQHVEKQSILGFPEKETKGHESKIEKVREIGLLLEHKLRKVRKNKNKSIKYL